MSAARPVIYLVLLLFCCGDAFCSPTNVPSDKGPYLMYSDSRALVIGAAHYAYGAAWPALEKVDAQVDKVTAVLQQQGFTVKTLLDPKYDDLTRAIKTFLLQKLDPNARLVIYYAGHGYSDDGLMGYIVPTDALPPTQDDFIPSLVSMDEIVGWGRGSSAKHVLVVFDSCFSGSVFLVRKNLTASTSAIYLNDIDRKGREYLTAGGYRESVPDGDDFSTAFMTGLGGDADYNHDGLVTASELGSFIRDSLIPLGIQHPQFGTDPRFDMKLGDMVFVPTRTDIKIALASESPGPRNSALRGLGDPRSDTSDIFRGVEVLYYQKTQDGKTVTKPLDEQKIPYVVTRAQLPETFTVNTIACAPDVPIEALKKTTLALIDSGVAVRRITTFLKPAEKPHRIEILSMTKDAAGKTPLDTPPVTRAQVEQLTACPHLLENTL
ncbi:caspase family protein [Rhizobium sp. CB3060]|uniref:caspase family protein n=1 Tax=Rhizobium sp. CB3060 TaxID=3138255 RepID=UPI0021A5C5D5|nr:caspase family protein [Rhizobium tropici]UWU23030.1 caspase family protein [Rhizobium tropici]